MSDIVVPGFKSSELIAELNKAFEGYSAEEKAKLIKQVILYLLSEKRQGLSPTGGNKKVNGVFQFVIKNSEGKEEIFTVDVKKEGKVVRGKGNVKADAILSLKDEDFVALATGKLNGKQYGKRGVRRRKITCVYYRPKGIHEWQAQDQGSNHAGHETRQCLQVYQARCRQALKIPAFFTVVLFHKVPLTRLHFLW